MFKYKTIERMHTVTANCRHTLQKTNYVHGFRERYFAMPKSLSRTEHNNLAPLQSYVLLTSANGKI